MVLSIRGKQVGPRALGIAGLTPSDGSVSLEQGIEILRSSAEVGCNWWFTSNANSLTLLRAYFERHPEDAAEVVVTMKRITVHSDSDVTIAGLDHAIRSDVGLTGDDAIGLSRLAGKKATPLIDQYTLPRIDGETPIGEMMDSARIHLDAGHFGEVALGDVDVPTLRAVADTGVPIGALVIQFSIFSQEPLHNGVLTTCAGLGIPVLAHGVMAHGLLTNSARSDAPGSPKANLTLVEHLKAVADRKGCSLPQLAVGWVLAIKRRPGMPVIVPVVQVSSLGRLDANLSVVQVTEDEIEEIQGLLRKFPAK